MSNINNTHRRIGTAGRSKSTVSLFQIQFNSEKTLKTAQQKPYGIPSKSIEEWNSKLKSRDTTGVPIFVGNDGTFYDINYVPVFKHKLPEKSTLNSNTSPKLDGLNGEEDEEVEETFQEQLFHLYNSIPQIDEYENFFDYEQAFLGWKFAVETIFQDTRLPNTTGRTYYRPKHVEFQSKIRETSINVDFSRPSVSSFSQGENDSDETKTDPSQSEVEETIEYDINALKDLENSSDPWDSLIVPQEPQPSDYDTFEDYDEALCRWASICSQLPFFPPHATQLRDLIPIQSVSESQLSQQDSLDEKKGLEKDGNVSSVPNIIIKSGIAEYQFLNNSLPERYKPTTPVKEEHVFQLIQKDQLPKIPENTRRVISAIFSTLEQRRQANYHANKSYIPTMIGKLHGTLPLPLLSNQKSTAMTFKNDHLRRTDLSLKQIQDHHDCPLKIGGVPVQFKVPDHDLGFEMNRLYSDPGYPSILMNQLKTFHTADRLDHLYSWYHPMVNEEHQKHKEEVDFIIMSSKVKDKLEIKNISDILYGDMYLDKFSDLLDSSFSEDFDGGKSYATVITKSVTPDNIDQLLGLLEYSKSPLFQAKMSHLVMHFFSGNKGSLILEKLIQNQDVKNLSLLTSSFDFISEVPSELFPWSNETYSLVKQVLGDQNEKLWKYIFCNYYLSVIGRVLDFHVHLYYSKPVITQSKVSLTHSIATLLQNNTPSILDKLFTGIRHRSITVSSFCLFILLQLMHNTEGLAISNCLKADGIFLRDRIKCVCDSKLKHVQFAARRLFSVLSKAPWVDFVYKEFNKDPDTSIKDFIGTEEKKPSNLLLELTLDLFTQSLDKALDAAVASIPITNTSSSNLSQSLGSSSSSIGGASTPPLSPIGSPPSASSGSYSNQPVIAPATLAGIKHKFSFVLDNYLFHNLYSFYIKNSKDSTYQNSVITCLLSKLAKTHCTLNNIQANQDLKSVKKWGDPKLSISASDVRSMLSKISEPILSPNQFTPLIKRNLLSMVRHLLKHFPVFENIKKEEDFYSKLQAFCKDGTYPELNREAWCLLYQLIRNHIGTLEALTSSKTLHGFLELVGIGSHSNVIINGLHYITKMFNISVSVPTSSDVKLTQKNKTDNKVIEKDIKSLNSIFIDKILFIKIHMIYKRYIGPQPGLAFIELAKFYNTLVTNPNCYTLMKDTKKKPEYKEGLTKIANMFLDPVAEQVNPEQTKPSSKAYSIGGGSGKDKSDKDRSDTGSGPNSPSTTSSTSTASSITNKIKFGLFSKK